MRLLIPPDGTDYASKDEVLEAFKRGEPFVSQPENKTVRRGDLALFGELAVEVHYAQHRRSVVIEYVCSDWRTR